MFWAAPSPVIADVRSAIALTNGQAGDSLTDGFFPTTRPAGRLPIQKNGGKA
jgi:hypothetical protein